MAQMASLLNTINMEGRNTVSLIQLFPSQEERRAQHVLQGNTKDT